MLDLIRPTSGRVLIFGLDARTDGVAVRRGNGSLAVLAAVLALLAFDRRDLAA